MKMTRRKLLAGTAAAAALPSLASSALAGDVPEAKVPKEAVIVLAQLKAKAGEEKAVREALVAMVGPTRKEKGCICYNLHQLDSDPTQFMFYEQWGCKDCLDAHGKTAHMKAMQEGIKGRIEKGGATFFKLIG
jgi:quinol monooxygenase YgiN